jgi:hypothetical protein
MATGINVTRYAPQTTPTVRTTWDVVVTEYPSGTILVQIPLPTDAESQRVLDEMLNLLSRFP